MIKRVVAPTLLIALVATLLVRLPMAIADRVSVYEWFDPLVDIRHTIVNRFVKEPDEELMQRAMIDAMIRTLDDPYTQYIPPAAITEFNKQLRGTYAGIGAEVNFVDGYLTIVSPMDDSPALQGGVMAGDVVLEIEGESTYAADEAKYQQKLQECVELLTGEAGTGVTMKVRHLDGAEEELHIIREHIVTTTVRGLRRRGEAWSYCVDDALDLSYVRVTQFNASTVSELEGALDALRGDGLGGLILDLRDNPGGSLPTAVGMADLFLDGGTIVSVDGRATERTVFTATRGGTLPDFPMIVLVNGNSASASEIISGALQENGRAKVLGSRTYGKGSVQEVKSLPYGAGTLKYTTAYYYLPSGRNLNRNPGNIEWGVDPDDGLVVTVSDEDYLARFRAREFEVIREIDDDAPICVDAAWIRENLVDEELALAVETISTRVRDGHWQTVSEEKADLAAIDQEFERVQLRRAELLAEIERADERRSELTRILEHADTRIDELAPLAAQAGRGTLLPENVDVVDGTITIRDRAGDLVGEFIIAGGDLALALEIMELRKKGEE